MEDFTYSESTELQRVWERSKRCLQVEWLEEGFTCDEEVQRESKEKCKTVVRSDMLMA